MDEVIAFVDGESRIQLVHGVKNLGGTTSRPNNKIVGIIGMRNQGICVELKEETMVTDVKFDAPSLLAYRNCVSTQELKNLTPDGGGSFKGSSAFIMAPFLRTAVLKAETNEPLELIPIVIHAAEEFDRENAVLNEDYGSAINHAEVFADWLWGISRNLVGETRFFLRPEVAKIYGYSVIRHQECIMGSISEG